MRILAATSVLALLIIAAPALAQPAGTGPRCDKSYSAYDAARGPKAIAIGRTKGCGYAYGKANLAEARKSAIHFCRAYGGDGCRVVESSM